jgi:hypothetical protein
MLSLTGVRNDAKLCVLVLAMCDCEMEMKEENKKLTIKATECSGNYVSKFVSRSCNYYFDVSY